jgi:calcineurin-like phosphoesterase family protein
MHLINIYGHTHQSKPFYNDIPFMFHVGLDSNGNKPVLLDDAIEIMKQETMKCLEFLDENINPLD